MKVILKYKKYIFITILSILLGFDLYFSIVFGVLANGSIKHFFLDDVAAGYTCRHLYLVSIIFSYASLIIVCLFNKIDERVKFVSIYASLCHIVIFTVLTLVSYYVNREVITFFSNIVWLIFSFFSLIIFGFTLFMAIKKKDELLEEDNKDINLF